MIAFVFAFISSGVRAGQLHAGLVAALREVSADHLDGGCRPSVLVGSTSDVTLALAWSALLVAIFTPIAILRYRHA